jgi:endonuclease/exonuclease/phosphatase family metal-dependent hydrolase
MGLVGHNKVDGGMVMKIKVMSFNIHHGKGVDGKLDLKRITDVIQKSEAEIVGLNEVDQFFSKRSRFVDQLTWISERLKMNEAFGPSFTVRSSDNQQRQYGNGVLSIYPIDSHKGHTIQSRKWTVEGRSLLETYVKVEDQTIKTLVTHLSLNPLFQRKQVKYIVDRITQEPMPVILMGDLNTKRGSKTWSHLSKYLTDVCFEVYGKPCPTYPSLRPKSQLDYIFASKHFQIDSAEVVKHHPEASDHLPVAVTLSIT